MHLSAGHTLGPYQILGSLGHGGMGEVYRARDPRIQRDVAIKILRGGFGDSEARRRFIREAHSAGALNHPNIAAVYDVNLDGPTPYIVTEFVDGQPLNKILSGSALPLKKVLDIAHQIAEGMAAAHAAPIVHRDLKPANILISKEGRVKVVDFGIAKAPGPTPMPASATASDATMTQNVTVTMEGVAIGTLYYMSPEQARGDSVDSRSDVFSFGVIFYEMLTGKRPFARKSAVETMDAIFNQEPPPIEQQLPREVLWILNRCLKKEAASRYNATLDLCHDLANVRENLTELIATGTFVTTKAPRRFGPAVALAGLALGAGLGYFAFTSNHFDAGTFQYQPLATTDSWEDWPVWAPQGDRLAYHRTMNGVAQIFTRALDAPTPLQVTHCPSNCDRPEWSADARLIYFRHRSGVWAVGAAGGEPKKVIERAESFSLSRDGKTLIYLQRETRAAGFTIWTSSPPGAEAREYKPSPFENVDSTSGSRAIFTNDGKHILVWARLLAPGRGSEFWLLPFPRESGEPKRVLASAGYEFPVRGFTFFPDGKTIAVAATKDPEVHRSHIHIADITADTSRLLIGGTGSEAVPAVSADGKRIAYTTMTYDADIIRFNLETSEWGRWLSTSRMEHSPSWSRRANEMVYATDRNGGDEIWLRNADTGREQPIVSAKTFHEGGAKFLTSPALSSDGDRVAFVRHTEDQLQGRDATEIWLTSISGGTPVRLTEVGGAQWAPTWSPDGSWIAFTSQSRTPAYMKVRVGYQDQPQILMPIDTSVIQAIPEWSPRGDWIAVGMAKGTMLISPDGTKQKLAHSPRFFGCGWSKDGSILYGQDTAARKLYAYNVDTGVEKVLADLPEGVRFGSVWNPGVRLSASYDGKSLTGTTVDISGDLWLLSNFAKPSLKERLFTLLGRGAN